MVLARVTACRPLSRVAAVSRRAYAVQAPGAPTLQVFNRHTKWLQKERAASEVEASRSVDYLKDEVAARLCDRLLDINRTFEHVLDFGAGACHVAKALAAPPLPFPDDESTTADTEAAPPISTRISHLTATDSSATLLHRDAGLPYNDSLPITRATLPHDEEASPLPYEPSTFDAVLSSLSLHWINNLPLILRHLNTLLKPDAPLLAAMLGGDSLFELRTALQLASQDRTGGVAATHMSPLADVRDVGGLLSAAGFKLLTVDVEEIVVEYPSMLALLADLQAMGESNAVVSREMGPISRDVLMAAEAIYREMHGEGDSVPATFRVIFLIGWKEAPGQAEPKARGSGDINLKELFEGGGGKTD